MGNNIYSIKSNEADKVLNMDINTEHMVVKVVITLKPRIEAGGRGSTRELLDEGTFLISFI